MWKHNLEEFAEQSNTALKISGICVPNQKWTVKINKDIIQAKSNLYILKAELSYLKRPDRIERIALTKLKMRPVLPIDIWNLEDLVSSKVSKHKEGL